MLTTFNMIFFCFCLMWTRGLRAEADMWRDLYEREADKRADLERQQSSSVRIIRVFSGGKGAA